MKKLLSLFLALFFVFICLPFSSSAASEPDNLSEAASGDTLYERMLNGILAQQQSIDISDFNTTADELADTASDMFYNEPDIFYVSHSFRYYTLGGSIISMAPIYTLNGDEITSAQQFVKSETDYIISTLPSGLDDYQKALYLHDYICVNYEYDTDYSNYDIYSMLKKGKGVCLAYTLLYDKLLSLVGIESSAVRCDSINHAWNQIKLGNKWYHADVTWGDPIADRFGYADHEDFLVSDAVIAKSHAPDFEAKYVCSDDLDSFFWHDINIPFGFANGLTYCIDGLALEQVDISQGTSTQIFFMGNTGHSCHSMLLGFGSYDNKLIFNVFDTLMYYNPKTDELKELATPKVGNGDIIKVYVNGDTAYYAVSQTVSVFDSEIYSLDLSAIKDKPVFNPSDADFSGNGKLDAVDILIAKRILLRTYAPTKEKLSAADANFDGKFTLIDYLIIKRLYLAK